MATPAIARAATSFSATVETEYRFRGVPITERPDARLAFAYDHPGGGYAGASALVGLGARNTVQALGYAAYAGYARRTRSGLTWDLGVTHARYHGRLVGRAVGAPPGPGRFTVHYDSQYSEAYAGVIRGDLSAHLHVTPSYLGQGLSAAYLDVAGAARPADQVRVFAHAGLMAPLGGSTRVYAPPPVARTGRGDDRRLRYDLRAGAAVTAGRAEVQLAWSYAGPSLEHPRDYRRSRSAVVLSAAVYF